jgi:hypothetical protein
MGSEPSKEARVRRSTSSYRQYRRRKPQKNLAEESAPPLPYKDNNDSLLEDEPNDRATIVEQLPTPEKHIHQEEKKDDSENMNGHSNNNNPPPPPRRGPAASGRSFVTDDQIKVNLAMADLMAYLQVVANNSSNLPHTRRDDPEIPKPVTNLTADEYGRKSAAFIPADVRVIAGSFTKYGRVWDLPTSEEFNAVDGAHEPGRSYGGACCNAMLKVLYDAANEAVDMSADEAAASNALFCDDDDESAMSRSFMDLSRDRTFASLTLGDIAAQSSISWAELLRKMKAEIMEIEYAQAPVITSSRKFDLESPFTLIPDDFDGSKNVKRSLLIGCNYSNIHGAELKASHDDVSSMKDYIVNVHGFSESRDFMTVLLDDGEHVAPTHHNITEAFKALSEQSQPGDAVFVQFSGHGGRVLDEESYDEVLVPSDFQTSGLIRDTLIFKTLLAPMRFGVTVTILIDCCDNGMVLELPYSWSTKTDRIKSMAKLSLNNDFSFVRFLKVVKTLYEASTFTQLGKTVGSALNMPSQDEVEEDFTLESGTMTGDEGVANEKTKPTKGDNSQGASSIPNLFSALTSCANPDAAALLKAHSKSALGKGQQSLIDKVLGCTLADELSDGEIDDDTYNRDLGNSTTFETDGDTSLSYSTDHRPRRRGRR